MLCDVPCSGDGTLRKSKDIWNKWRPGHALALHEIQLRILVRGLQLLEVGGTLSYSTCSLNVIENESIVGAVLNAFGDALEVVDCSDMLPEVQRDAGLT